MSLQQGQKIYFASDIHFGEPDLETSRKREKKLLDWLGHIRSEAAAIFFVGDVFDFWFEYRHVVPKGSVRFLGRLAELVDEGLPVYIFPGNHDMWMNDYLETEVGVHIIRDRLIIESNDKRIFVAHGDGLGPEDKKFKLLKKVFSNPFCQWLFRWLHPDIGIKIATLWSRRSRKGHSIDKFNGPENEWLVTYAKRKLETEHLDYFVFGHRHIPLEYQINEKSKYINLGDWIVNNTYGEFSSQGLYLRSFEE
ncbi:MAG: UDP-2,3-diacylglucosamine diphosphatase [Bacteroidetes bacterium]|nr:UDP-2,3-diacylglucosamine diphosphatase [Bacteroidota bacterium]